MRQAAPPVRAWYLIELAPGYWQGQRFDRGKFVFATRTGEEWQARAAVMDHRQGLPILRRPFNGAAGGTAA